MTQGQDPLYIPYAGSILLETPLLNKGSAFDENERNCFNLTDLKLSMSKLPELIVRTVVLIMILISIST